MIPDLIDRLRTFQSRLLLAIHGIPEDALRRPEGEQAWSIFDVIAHLGDLETVTAVRIRTILARDNPPLPPLEQNEWVARVHEGESLASALECFWSARRNNLALLDRLPAAAFQRRGTHPSYGSVSLADVVTRLEAHQEKHLGQVERIKKTLALSTSDLPQVGGVRAFRADTATVRTLGEGITIRDLWRDGVKRALRVELAPGAQWPGLDYHVPGPEAVYVVSGDFGDGANVYREGTFLHHPAGSSHSPRSSEGCVLFVYYPEG